MVITQKYIDLNVDDSTLRVFVAAPKNGASVPGVIFYSDIFQLTRPMIRACSRLAGYGYVVAAPEIYHRIEPAGTVIPFDDEGRERGLANALRTSVSEFDKTCREVLDYLSVHPQVTGGKLFAAGFCIGGHLAFRAAMNPEVLATTCFYPTGIHTGKLGKDADAGSLQRVTDIRGDLLLVFGSGDPHIPEEGRATIIAALAGARTKFQLTLYPAEHAFMRDEGPRYDPQATDEAFYDMVRLFRAKTDVRC